MPFVLSKSARKNRLDVFTSQIVKLQNSKTHPYIKCCLDGLSLRSILLIFTSFFGGLVPKLKQLYDDTPYNRGSQATFAVEIATVSPL